MNVKAMNFVINGMEMPLKFISSPLITFQQKQVKKRDQNDYRAKIFLYL